MKKYSPLPKKQWVALAALFMCTQAIAQNPDLPPKGWHLQKFEKTGVAGINLEEAYAIIAGLPAKKVVVAVIDNGVDINHEDLKDVIWVNRDEIPGNNKDDDGNGYVDDVYGWNFLGNASGENIHYDNLEMTRIYASLDKKFQGKTEKDIPSADKADFELYQEFGATIEEKRKEYEQNFMLYGMLNEAIETIISAKGTIELSKEDVQNLDIENQAVQRFKGPLGNVMEAENWTFAKLAKEIERSYEYFYARYNYYYNPEVDARAIIGDNPANPRETGYGNGDVHGPDPFHGTHAAGVIAAVRNNGIGVDGVADQVEIMAIRAVPEGDEHDKDVANAIRYAVDNGADIINMSFGKGQSPLKDVVDEAIRYAAKNDVLIIHSAGNDAKENTPEGQFPNDRYRKAPFLASKKAKNWIEVGASGPWPDASLAADFSNYSPIHVDLMAPGVSIYSTYTNSTYDWMDGTSFSGPVVSGVAAMIRSHFPQFKAKEVRDIILQSAYKPGQKVTKPGTDDVLVPMSDLCVTGGIIDARAAIQLAKARAGK